MQSLTINIGQDKEKIIETRTVLNFSHFQNVYVNLSIDMIKEHKDWKVKSCIYRHAGVIEVNIPKRVIKVCTLYTTSQVPLYKCLFPTIKTGCPRFFRNENKT